MSFIYEDADLLETLYKIGQDASVSPKNLQRTVSALIDNLKASLTTSFDHLSSNTLSSLSSFTQSLASPTALFNGQRIAYGLQEFSEDLQASLKDNAKKIGDVVVNKPVYTQFLNELKNRAQDKYTKLQVDTIFKQSEKTGLIAVEEPAPATTTQQAQPQSTDKSQPAKSQQQVSNQSSSSTTYTTPFRADNVLDLDRMFSFINTAANEPYNDAGSLQFIRSQFQGAWGKYDQLVNERPIRKIRVDEKVDTLATTTFKSLVGDYKAISNVLTSLKVLVSMSIDALNVLVEEPKLADVRNTLEQEIEIGRKYVAQLGRLSEEAMVYYNRQNRRG